MKRGTHYAKKLKRAYGKFRGSAGTKPNHEPSPPIDQMILAVLSQENSTQRTAQAVKQIHDDLVDYNELRVSTPAEISECIGRHIPRKVQRAKELTRLLNAVYRLEYDVSLESLKSKGIREVKGYLERLDGITPYVTASIVLWSLGGHAIPISDPVLAFLKKQELVDPDATGAEVQAFLERHISAADARSFCLDLEAFAMSQQASSTTGRKSRGGTRASAKRTVKKRRAAGSRPTKKKATKKTTAKAKRKIRRKKKIAV